MVGGWGGGGGYKSPRDVHPRSPDGLAGGELWEAEAEEIVQTVHDVSVSRVGCGIWWSAS